MNEVQYLYLVGLASSMLFVVVPTMWILAGFIAWRKDGLKPHFFCYHDLTYGGGGMGDAVQCSKCGLNTYDGFNGHLWIFRLLGRVKNI
jgi:hypothetical protein